MSDQERRAQLRAVATTYFEALAKKDFAMIPYDDNVSLRAPLAPGGVQRPLVGKQNLLEQWWAPLPSLLGEVELFEVYFNEDLTAVIGEADIEVLVDPPVHLRVADRFTVDAAGHIIEQENHFDPRDFTNPGWQTEMI